LEFDQVGVPFCSDAEYQTVIDRHMLYVGCTRAMHKLSRTHTAAPSRFLQPALQPAPAASRLATNEYR
jgi:DNA helicase-2/ATP-dependent DNA helicase PcrA